MARGGEAGRYPVLYPLIALAASRVGASAVGLVDVGRGAGLNLQVDRVGIGYGGVVLGDASSSVQVRARVVSGAPVPSRPLPRVVARVAVGRTLSDVTDEAEVHRLLALAAASSPEQTAALEAELALAATAAPDLVRGDPVERLPSAVAIVPPDALPVVLTTWTLSALPAARRRSFFDRLVEVGSTRPVAWVSVEGVGVAPEVPTYGDRPASGHSILGLGLFDGSGARVEAVGRCWSRGSVLAWLGS